jgi:hypothetical protein
VLPLTLEKQDPLFDTKLKIFEDNKLTNYSLYADYRADDMFSAIALLRYSEFNQGEKNFHLYKNAQQKAGLFDTFRGQFNPISWANEKAVHLKLIKVMTERKTKYKTTLSEDKVILE